jgi:hypothetical protein
VARQLEVAGAEAAVMRAAVLFVGLALCACGHDGANVDRGEKPAAPAATPEKTANPHAGMDPHAGMMPPAAAAEAPVAWTVPDGWRAEPGGGMRVAEFAVGEDEAGDAVKCIVYGGIGGTDEENIERWVGQMGETAKAAAKTTHVDHDGLKITRFEARGDFTDAMRRGPPKTIAAATMLAAIVDGPAGKLHLKFVGPSSVVDAAAPKFDAFLASMKAK